MNTPDRVWNGSVNVRVRFLEATFLVPMFRVSYFPAYYSKIYQFFSLLATPIGPTFWLEYESVPVKWHEPVGVLYDVLCVLDNSSVWDLDLKVATTDNPYPESLIPFLYGSDYERMLRQIVINQLKQSCYVINGNSRAMMSLSEADTDSLWKAVVTHDYETYHRIDTKVRHKSKFQKIPLRVLVSGSTTMILGPVSRQIGGIDVTLGEILSNWLGDFFVNHGAVPYVHGINIEVLLDQPLAEVWEKFRHLDNFIYVVMRA